MNVRGVDTYLIPTTRFADAVRFFRDTAQLPIVFELPGMVVFDLGALSLTISRAPADAPPMLSLIVPDLAPALRALRDGGATIVDEPIFTDDGGFATFIAPGGGHWGVIQLPEGGA
ncbi:MAG: hypothetical protein NZ518_00315 [Dehalococcoidia bacterium]|nr:hypothetical protein [Dehalococcoidia bacterium]